jgi:hypothetical protein
MIDSTSQFQLAPDDGGQDEGKISFMISAIVLVVIIVAFLLVQVFGIGTGTRTIKLTDEQKLEALSKLAGTPSVTPLSEKEKLSVLSKLADNKNTTITAMTEEEKLQVLGQLSK